MNINNNEINCECGNCGKATKFKSFKDAYMEGWSFTDERKYVCYECVTNEKMIYKKTVDIGHLT